MCSGLWPAWPREMNVLGWRALLGDRVGMDHVSPYAAPARAENLRNLPSAYIEVGGMEVFRDEQFHSIPPFLLTCNFLYLVFSMANDIK